MPNKEFLSYNFTNPLQESQDLDKYLEYKKESIKTNLVAPVNTKPSSRSWLLVFILMISLIGLGTFALVKNRENEKQIAALKNQSVAGSTDSNSKNIVSADNFSLILDSPTPSNFSLQRKVITSPFLDSKDAVQTTFLGTDTKAGQQLTSGLEVQISEYDNKLDKTLFEETVLKKLGDKYEIKSRDVTLPKNIKVTKVQQKNDDVDLVYYITVTEDNYYIIKVYDEGARYTDFKNTTKFTESLLPNLYLN